MQEEDDCKPQPKERPALGHWGWTQLGQRKTVWTEEELEEIRRADDNPV